MEVLKRCFRVSTLVCLAVAVGGNKEAAIVAFAMAVVDVCITIGERIKSRNK